MSAKTCQVHKVAVSWVQLLPPVFQKGPLAFKVSFLFFFFFGIKGSEDPSLLDRTEINTVR